MKNVVGFVVFSIVASTLLMFAEESANEISVTNRPAHWAQPIEKTGVPNLHKVSDMLYRSAQPTAAGMRELKKMGVKTVVNLRSFHSDRDEIGDTTLQYEHIYMKAHHPEDKELVRFLKIITNSNRAPVLVHCQHGADRTGTMSALYRIVVCGWSKDDAIEEMKKGGYGFHTIWGNLPKYIHKLDIADLRKKAGMPPLKPVKKEAQKKEPVKKKPIKRTKSKKGIGFLKNPTSQFRLVDTL